MRETLSNDSVDLCQCGARPSFTVDDNGIHHIDCVCGNGLDAGSAALAIKRWNRPRHHLPHSPRIKVAKVQKLLPPRFIERLEQNQQIASCCRHPENHEIEALRSSERQRVPDVYIFHCDKCGRKHGILCVGQSSVAKDGTVIAREKRPAWETR